MTVEEARRRRDGLEAELIDAVREFESATGLLVRWVDIRRVETHVDTKQLVGVELTVEMKR